MSHEQSHPMNPNDDPARLAAETDEVIQGLLPEGSFQGLSPEDAAVLQEWGQEARDAHLTAQAANVGHAALTETAAVETGKDDGKLVSVGNAILTQGSLKRYENEGQDFSGSSYRGNRRA